MWIAAITGMATKYAEILLAMHFREKDERGVWRGGVMYILTRGMSANWKWLAKILGVVFAVCCVLVSFVSCNAVQSSSMSSVLGSTLPVIPAWAWGLLAAGLSGICIVGGIRKIGHVCTVLTPVMAAIYIFFGIIILILNAGRIPAALLLIVRSAFSNKAAWGGLTAVVWPTS